ncbi:MAG: YjjG family noncanonical pyrimidine nucleotidase [Oscillospiraceae bacterium]|nr:YjjG family noncanonical pyrimidine nucleotidase [Oscillospiraceae bacterium]MBQ9930582.1 YjjG family noncanonical pyrimidine nucleotidase [Oscillospiraceae bacterium]
MIEFLFLDLDDTILDFKMAERLAIPKTLSAFGVNVTDALLCRYHAINKTCWEMLERGELTRDEVGVRRFAELFAQEGVEADAAACNALYLENLANGHYFLPGAQEALQRLHKKYRLYIASNGTASVQEGRMTSAELYPYFEKVFISEHLGANKPAGAFFERSFAQIPDFDPKKAMIVGDSLTSDILGGINAGIATCWVNPGHKPGKPEIQPDYEIESLAQLEELLKTLK